MKRKTSVYVLSSLLLLGAGTLLVLFAAKQTQDSIDVNALASGLDDFRGLADRDLTLPAISFPATIDLPIENLISAAAAANVTLPIPPEVIQKLAAFTLNVRVNLPSRNISAEEFDRVVTHAFGPVGNALSSVINAGRSVEKISSSVPTAVIANGMLFLLMLFTLGWTLGLAYKNNAEIKRLKGNPEPEKQPLQPKYGTT